jgi:hypothetical protein
MPVCVQDMLEEDEMMGKPSPGPVILGVSRPG